MRPIVKYSERTRSIFCANCGTIVVTAMPVKEVEALAKSGFKAHCNECKPSVERITELEKEIDLHKTHYAFRVMDLKDLLGKEVNLRAAQIEVERGHLAKVALDESLLAAWRSMNN